MTSTESPEVTPLFIEQSFGRPRRRDSWKSRVEPGIVGGAEPDESTTRHLLQSCLVVTLCGRVRRGQDLGHDFTAISDLNRMARSNQPQVVAETGLQLSAADLFHSVTLAALGRMSMSRGRYTARHPTRKRAMAASFH